MAFRRRERSRVVTFLLILWSLLVGLGMDIQLHLGQSDPVTLKCGIWRHCSLELWVFICHHVHREPEGEFWSGSEQRLHTQGCKKRHTDESEGSQALVALTYNPRYLGS
jgi:hypothetical protein